MIGIERDTAQECDACVCIRAKNKTKAYPSIHWDLLILVITCYHMLPHHPVLGEDLPPNNPWAIWGFVFGLEERFAPSPCFWTWIEQIRSTTLTYMFANATVNCIALNYATLHCIALHDMTWHDNAIHTCFTCNSYPTDHTYHTCHPYPTYPT